MRVISENPAADGTKKFLFELDDKQRVEGVLIQHKRTVSACLSSQVGCPMKCEFCATGKMGFIRNLSAEEIIEQFDIMNQNNITNVVFMGMGEPLLNYQAVIDTINELRKREFGWRKITVSTVGIPNRIRTLSKDTQCKLAISLHSPNDELRSKLVPVNKRYPIKEIFDACKEYLSTEKNPIMIEYVLIKNVNDGEKQAKELAELLKQLPYVVINLIRFNSVEGISYERPSEETVKKFKQLLIDAGYKTIIRTSKGVNVSAACGMLATKNNIKGPQKSVVE